MKLKFFVVCIVCATILLVGSLYFNAAGSDSTNAKTDILNTFYSSYENKDIDLYNSSVVDELKVKNKDDEDLRNSIYKDIIKFKVLEIKELANPSLEFNGMKYSKENIAKFEVFYEVDFKDNLTSSEEGKVSTIKILTRQDTNSPWLVAGQDGHGL